MANQDKISTLVSQQVPEFVRDEHPRFIAFLEAYYEFLEQNGQFIGEIPTLRQISDVDVSINEFEKNYFNTYASLFPLDVAVSKENLIKNALPFYLTKGSEKSFKFLFRSLFDADVTITEPNQQILRASDGKWVVEKSLRVKPQVYSKYTADGTATDFHLAQTSGIDEITVYVNSVVQTTGFIVLKESRDIIFDSAPAANSTIKVLYDNFNFDILESRKVTGVTSGAYGVIDKVGQRVIGQDNFYDLYISDGSRVGVFTNAELVTSDVILDGIKVYLELETISNVQSITIDNGGASYNVGDIVIFRGEADRTAYAIVDRVSTGSINSLTVQSSGSGFNIGNDISANGYTTTAFAATVGSIDATGITTPNTITVYTDVIGTFNGSIHAANTTLSTTDWGFAKVGTQNLTNTIISALISNTFAIGGITSTVVSVSTIDTNTALPEFNSNSPIVGATSPTVGDVVRLKDLGVIGKVNIVDGGDGYVIGDTLVFTNPPMEFSGRGATGYVQNVSVTGAITSVNVTGGMGYYDSTKWPTISVNSSGGANAVLTIDNILGDGESFIAVSSNTTLGQVLSIRILDGGAGYVGAPVVDLSSSGNGQATGNVVLQDSFVSFPGKWITTDSFLSSYDRRLNSGLYYNNFSYLLTSQVEFSRYKEILKKLVHPSGFTTFANYQVDRDITNNLTTSELVSFTREVSGTVNVTAGSIYVTGTNTKFNVASDLGIITIGSIISVNNEVVSISSIISNTNLSVTVAFTNTANYQPMIVLSDETFYIATETGLDILLTETSDQFILE